MILFRPINSIAPPNWRRGVHWYVEFHDDEADMAFPLGVAYVSDFRGSTTIKRAVLDFVLVADQHRRNGVGRKLVEACRERFGADILLTHAISDAGVALLRSVGVASPMRVEESPE